MRRPINYLVPSILLIAIALLFIVRYIVNMPSPAPPSAQHVPVFPAASHLHEDYTRALNVVYVSFTTSATPKEVQNYYKGVLLSDGWTLDIVSSPTTPDSLYFSYLGGRFPDGFALQLIISPLASGELSVEITRVADNIAA